MWASSKMMIQTKAQLRLDKSAINRMATITAISRIASITAISRIASITAISRIASIMSYNKTCASAGACSFRLSTRYSEKGTTYIYIYIERERERDRERDIYIYTYTCFHRHAQF